MARIVAIFYQGDTPVASYVGDWEGFVRNRDAEGLPWRVLTGTPWAGVESYRSDGVPTPAEVDAWTAENPAAGPDLPQT